MKKIIILISCVSLTLTGFAQEEYSMHFMRNVWNSNYTNPGFQPYQTFFIGGTSVGTSLSLKGLGGTQLFSEDTSGAYVPNYQDIIDNVDEDLRIRSSVSAELFGVGFKVKKLFFSFSTSAKASAQVTLPKDLFELAWYGNEQYIGQTVEFGPQVNIEAYQELALGVNYTFSRKLSAGIRAKRLLGIFSATTTEHDLALTTGTNHYSATLDANYVANISSSFLNIVAPPSGKILDTDATFNQAALDNITQNRQLPSGNTGWAADLGVSLNLKDRLELGLSVLDLGYINWTNGVSGLQTTGTYNFDGLTLEQSSQGGSISFVSVQDSFINLLNVSNIAGSTFRTTLAPKIYASALIKYGKWEVGGMWYNEFSGGQIISSIGLSGRYNLDDKLSFGAVYAYHDGHFDNIGGNLAFRLGPLQLHLLVDNILPLFKPETIEYTNIRAGFNIALGTKKMTKFRKGRLDEAAPPPPSNSETN